MKKIYSWGLVFLAGILLAGAVLTAPLTHATVPIVNTLVSVNNTGNGQGGNGASPVGIDNGAVISANGKYAVFSSSATDLVSGDTNGVSDVFVRDLVNNTTTRVSVSTAGIQGNGHIASYSASVQAISSNGRYIVFRSNATNLIDGQTVPAGQLYMRDTFSGITSLVTQKNDGTIGNSNVISVGDVSNDGRFVTWVGSRDTNLVSTEINTQSQYVYLADLKTRTFTVLNHTPSTGQYFVSGTTMSCDGSLIAFSTKLQLDSSDMDASEDIYLVDIRNGLTASSITSSSNSASYSIKPIFSCNGEYMTFESNDTAFGTTGTDSHKFLYDRLSNSISVVDTSSAGVLGNKSASGNAGVDNKGNVVFSSTATNLTSSTIPTAQVYLKHNDTGAIEIISLASPGNYANGAVIGGVSISSDGKKAIYCVGAAVTNLISSDTNAKADIISSLTGL